MFLKSTITGQYKTHFIKEKTHFFWKILKCITLNVDRREERAIYKFWNWKLSCSLRNLKVPTFGIVFRNVPVSIMSFLKILFSNGVFEHFSAEVNRYKWFRFYSFHRYLHTILLLIFLITVFVSRNVWSSLFMLIFPQYKNILFYNNARIMSYKALVCSVSFHEFGCRNVSRLQLETERESTRNQIITIYSIVNNTYVNVGLFIIFY